MLVLAAIFRCLDPVSETSPFALVGLELTSPSQILTIVALLSSKPFFLNPMEQRDAAKKCV